MATVSGAGSVQEFKEQQAATRQQQLQSELAVRCQRPAFVRAALVRYLQGKQWSAIQHVICGHNDGGSRVAPAMVENKVVLALGDRDKRISLTDLPEHGAVPPGAIAIPRCKTAFVTSAGPLRTHATVRNHDVDGQVQRVPQVRVARHTCYRPFRRRSRSPYTCPALPPLKAQWRGTETRRSSSATSPTTASSMSSTLARLALLCPKPPSRTSQCGLAGGDVRCWVESVAELFELTPEDCAELVGKIKRGTFVRETGWFYPQGVAICDWLLCRTAQRAAALGVVGAALGAGLPANGGALNLQQIFAQAQAAAMNAPNQQGGAQMAHNAVQHAFGQHGLPVPQAAPPPAGGGGGGGGGGVAGAAGGGGGGAGVG